MSNNATGNVFASIREVAIELEGLEKNGETESSSARVCAKKFSSLSESVQCRASCSGCQSCFMGRLLAASTTMWAYLECEKQQRIPSITPGILFCGSPIAANGLLRRVAAVALL